MTDPEFVLAVFRMRNGDKAGLKQIYQEYITMISAVIYEILQNKENTEDVASEFFIKLWNQADKFKEGKGHKSWLITIARNMAIDFYRKNKREQLTEEIKEPDWKGSSREKPVEYSVVEDMTIQQTLATLEAKEREIINLKVLGDLTFKEVAKVLKMPMGTVTWKYREGIKKLRRCGYEQGL